MRAMKQNIVDSVKGAYSVYAGCKYADAAGAEK